MNYMMIHWLVQGSKRRQEACSSGLVVNVLARPHPKPRARLPCPGPPCPRGNPVSANFCIHSASTVHQAD